MKQLKKKTTIVKTKKKTLATKMKRSKGLVDAGTVYGVILLGIVLGGGIMMLGNTAPKIDSPDQNQPVIIQKGNNTDGKSNLQLEDFPGITLTPTPTPSPTPTPKPTTPPSSSGGGGGGGGSSCFAKGTKILMADKSEKNIEDVKVGDKVMGYDGHKQVAETVLELESPIRDHIYKLTFADGTTLELTREHPLFTKDGWKSISPASTAEENPNLKVATLSIGDQVLNTHGKYVEVKSMQFTQGSIQTYNLKSVSGYNNYFAGKKLAHNKGSCFVKGTKVLMADGSQKNIEDVKVGDKVMGYDGKKKVAETVLELESPIRDHYYNVSLSDRTVVGVTREHPLLTTDGWKSISPASTAEENASLKVGTLRLGDKVRKSDGKAVTVVSMEYVHGTVQTYNLRRVSGTNTFYANGIVAHNKGGGGGGGGGGGSSGGGAM